MSNIPVRSGALRALVAIQGVRAVWERRTQTGNTAYWGVLQAPHAGFKTTLRAIIRVGKAHKVTAMGHPQAPTGWTSADVLVWARR